MCVKQVSLLKCEICSPGLRHVLFVKYFLCVITRCYVNHGSVMLLHVFCMCFLTQNSRLAICHHEIFVCKQPINVCVHVTLVVIHLKRKKEQWIALPHKAIKSSGYVPIWLLFFFLWKVITTYTAVLPYRSMPFKLKNEEKNLLDAKDSRKRAQYCFK